MCSMFWIQKLPKQQIWLLNFLSKNLKLLYEDIKLLEIMSLSTSSSLNLKQLLEVYSFKLVSMV